MTNGMQASPPGAPGAQMPGNATVGWAGSMVSAQRRARTALAVKAVSAASRTGRVDVGRRGRGGLGDHVSPGRGGVVLQRAGEAAGRGRWAGPAPRS